MRQWIHSCSSAWWRTCCWARPNSANTGYRQHCHGAYISRSHSAAWQLLKAPGISDCWLITANLTGCHSVGRTVNKLCHLNFEDLMSSLPVRSGVSFLHRRPPTQTASLNKSLMYASDYYNVWSWRRLHVENRHTLFAVSLPLGCTQAIYIMKHGYYCRARAWLARKWQCCL